MTTSDRDAWLQARRSAIGSSDAAAVCGLRAEQGVRGVYQTALGVYLDKRGVLPPSDSAPKRWGRMLEDVVAQAFAEETGLSVSPAPESVRHPRHPFMAANADRLVPQHAAVLECKTSRSAEGWGPTGTDLVPEGYLVQVMHQLEVMGAERGYVAVLIAGSDFRWYEVPRSPELCERLVALEAEFWRRVEDADPPEPDWTHPETPALLALLHRPVAGESVELDAASASLADLYQSLGEDAKRANKLRDRAKAELIARLGTASTGLLPDGRRVTRKVIPRKGYTVEPGESEQFRVSGRAAGPDTESQLLEE